MSTDAISPFRHSSHSLPLLSHFTVAGKTPFPSSVPMELESEDGTRLPIEEGVAKEIGRGFGYSSSDKTVSRCHLSLQLLAPATNGRDESDPEGETKLSFEVVGKNPILVITGGRDGERRVVRKSEKGELGAGDRFSLSLKNPSLFTVRSVGAGGGSKGKAEESVLNAVRGREEMTLQRRKEREEEEVRKMESEKVSGMGKEEEGLVAELEFGFEPLDISNIDPIKEFGFLARGHEFDHYPRQRVHAIKDWDWFLNEPRETSEDYEDPSEEIPKRKKGKKGQRRVGDDNGDEDWTGESEDEKVSVAKVGSAKRPKYSTRSKDKGKQQKDASSGMKLKQTKAASPQRDEIDEGNEDEEDETLGGFIVDDSEEEIDGGEEEGFDHEDNED